MATFSQINGLNSSFFKGGKVFTDRINCDYIDNSLYNYTQYCYTSTNKTGTFYLKPIVDTSINILAIGGGGSGARDSNGGGCGGAGGFVETYYNVPAYTEITIIINIGEGGENSNTWSHGKVGKNTTLKFKQPLYNTITAYGGGGGSNGDLFVITQNGASGGGARNGNGAYVGNGNRIPGTNTVITGTSQGFNSPNRQYCTSGGGAGDYWYGNFKSNYFVGSKGKTPSNNAFYKNKHYCSGGALYPLPGGGGSSSNYEILSNKLTGNYSKPGEKNTGGGGGSSIDLSGNVAGGSGLVIISIMDSSYSFFNSTGNVNVSNSVDNNYLLFSFLNNGSFYFTENIPNTKCLIVGGGGCGGVSTRSPFGGFCGSGGGGGGQVVEVNDISFNKNTVYTIKVGNGGYSTPEDNNNVRQTIGESSNVINSSNNFTITAPGGGCGGYSRYAADNYNPIVTGSRDGGCGGGGCNLKVGNNQIWDSASGKSDLTINPKPIIVNSMNIIYHGSNGGNIHTNGGGGGGGANTTGNLETGGNGFTWDLNGKIYGGGGGGTSFKITGYIRPLVGTFNTIFYNDCIGGIGGGGHSSNVFVNTKFNPTYSVKISKIIQTFGTPNTGGGGGGYHAGIEPNAEYGIVTHYNGIGGSGIVIIAIPINSLPLTINNIPSIDYYNKYITTTTGYKALIYYQFNENYLGKNTVTGIEASASTNLSYQGNITNNNRSMNAVSITALKTNTPHDYTTSDNALGFTVSYWMKLNSIITGNSFITVNVIERQTNTNKLSLSIETFIDSINVSIQSVNFSYSSKSLTFNIGHKDNPFYNMYTFSLDQNGNCRVGFNNFCFDLSIDSPYKNTDNIKKAFSESNDIELRPSGNQINIADVVFYNYQLSDHEISAIYYKGPF